MENLLCVRLCDQPLGFMVLFNSWSQPYDVGAVIAITILQIGKLRLYLLQIKD